MMLTTTFQEYFIARFGHQHSRGGERTLAGLPFRCQAMQPSHHDVQLSNSFVRLGCP